jgi:hypothetical protein
VDIEIAALWRGSLVALLGGLAEALVITAVSNDGESQSLIARTSGPRGEADERIEHKFVCTLWFP